MLLGAVCKLILIFHIIACVAGFFFLKTSGEAASRMPGLLSPFPFSSSECQPPETELHRLLLLKHFDGP